MPRLARALDAARVPDPPRGRPARTAGLGRPLAGLRRAVGGVGAAGGGAGGSGGARDSILTTILHPEIATKLVTWNIVGGVYGIEIGGGLGDFKGKVWRIGIMGHNSRPVNVLLVLGALEACLGASGGVAAANKAYAAM